MGFFACFFKNNYAYPHGETFFVHQLFLTQPLRQTGEHQCPTLICQHVRGLLSPRQHKLPLSLYTWALTLCLSDVRQIRPRARRAAADLCANQLITATGTIALHYATLRVCVCVQRSSSWCSYTADSCLRNVSTVWCAVTSVLVNLSSLKYEISLKGWFFLKQRLLLHYKEALSGIFTFNWIVLCFVYIPFLCSF